MRPQTTEQWTWAPSWDFEEKFLRLGMPRAKKQSGGEHPYVAVWEKQVHFKKHLSMEIVKKIQTKMNFLRWGIR